MEVKFTTNQELEKEYLSNYFPKNPNRPYVVINMVMSLDGSVTVVDPKTHLPSERGLGSKLDQRLMRVHRFHADATLNGAETLRISGSGAEIGDRELEERRKDSGRMANPVACILTRDSANLPLDKANEKSKFFYSKDFEKVIFTTTSALKENIDAVRNTGCTVEIIPNSSDNVKLMLGIMKDKYNIDLLLCEGGPTINGSLLKNNLVDEIFITMALRIVAGGKHPFELLQPLTKDSLVKASLLSAFFVEETNEFYFRYKIDNS